MSVAACALGLLLEASAGGSAPLTLERSEGLRLLAESRAALSADPALALLLGIEGALRLPGARANDTLVDALEALRERRTLDLQEPGWGLPLLSPDGRQAVSFRTGEAVVWDVQGERIAYRVSLGAETGIARLSADSTRLVLLDEESVRTFEVAAGRELATLRASSRERFTLLSPDGGLALRQTDSRTSTGAWLAVLATDTGRVVASREMSSVPQVAFAPDGRRLLFLGHCLEVWPFAVGEPPRQVESEAVTFSEPRFSADRGTMVTGGCVGWCCVAVPTHVWDLPGGEWRSELEGVVWGPTPSPDGSRVAAMGRQGPGLWDTSTGKRVASLGARGDAPQLLVFSPDGRRLLVAFSKGGLWLHDARTGVRLKELLGRERFATAAAFDPRGERLVAAVGDSPLAPLVAQVWSAASGRMLAALSGHDRRIHSVGFAPGGKDVITASIDGTTRWWQISPGDLTRLRPERRLTHAAFRPDGREVLVVVDGDLTAVPFRPPRMEVRNAQNGSLRLALELHTGNTLGAWWSPDGRAIAVSDHMWTNFFDAADGKPIEYVVSRDNRVLAPLDLHRDGRRLLAASSSGLLVLDLETRAPTATFTLPADSRPTRAAVYQAAGERVFSIDGRGEVRAWDAVSGSETARWTAGPGAAAFSPDGRFVATGGAPGREDVMRLWSVSSREETGRFRTAEGGTTWLRFSPDGRYLLAALFAGPGRLYDVGAGAELLTLNRGGRALVAASFLPDGRHIRTIAADGAIRTWPLDPLREALARRPRELTARELAEYEIEPSRAPPRNVLIDRGTAARE